MSGTRNEALANARFNSPPPITARPTRNAAALSGLHQFLGEAFGKALATTE
jgi:hypothetical protein